MISSPGFIETTKSNFVPTPKFFQTTKSALISPLVFVQTTKFLPIFVQTNKFDLTASDLFDQKTKSDLTQRHDLITKSDLTVPHVFVESTKSDAINHVKSESSTNHVTTSQRNVADIHSIKPIFTAVIKAASVATTSITNVTMRSGTTSDTSITRTVAYIHNGQTNVPHVPTSNLVEKSDFITTDIDNDSFSTYTTIYLPDIRDGSEEVQTKSDLMNFVTSLIDQYVLLAICILILIF